MNPMLEFLNVCVLLICLLIIKDIVRELRERREKGVKAFFFLRANIFIRSLKVMICAIILWSIKEGIRLFSHYYPFEILEQIYDIIGIIIAIILSYGLYLLIMLIKSAEGQIRLRIK